MSWRSRIRLHNCSQSPLDGLDDDIPTPDDAVGAPTAPAGMMGDWGPLLRLISDQRVAFLLVGGVNTAVGAAWFILFQHVVQERLGYMVVLLCAHVTSVLCAFVLYRYLVFRVRGHVLRDLLRFELINLTSLVINAAILPVLVEVVHWPVLFSQLMIVGITMLVSFFGHRGFSFHRSADDHAETPIPLSDPQQTSTPGEPT